MKVVINENYGGFNLTALARYAFNRRSPEIYFTQEEIPRDHPVLVQVVERLGRMANRGSASLKVVEFPDDVDWVLQESDGKEWIAERHRTWR